MVKFSPLLKQSFDSEKFRQDGILNYWMKISLKTADTLRIEKQNIFMSHLWRNSGTLPYAQVQKTK